jgi:cell division protein FtsQ
VVGRPPRIHFAPAGRLLIDRRHPRRLLAAILACLLLLLGCAWLWFRDSPFVSVSMVRVTGLSGPQVPRIEQALRAAAVTMTTLDVNMSQLRTAVEPYPDVRSLTVQTQFPHGLVIHVREQVPIAQLQVDGRSLAISRDGTLLADTQADARLPTLPVPVPPAGTRLTEPGPRLALTVLAAAPYRFLSHIASARQTLQNGVVIQLRHGPQLRFGDTAQLAAKWAAALAVLGSASSHGAQYIDVTDPGRPAAGAPTPSASSTGATTTTSTASSATSSTSAGPSISTASTPTVSSGGAASTAGSAATGGTAGTTAGTAAGSPTGTAAGTG